MVLFARVLFLIAQDKRLLYVELNENTVGATATTVREGKKVWAACRRLAEDAARGETGVAAPPGSPTEWV